jgi:hypothetical protein
MGPATCQSCRTEHAAIHTLGWAGNAPASLRNVCYPLTSEMRILLLAAEHGRNVLFRLPLRAPRAKRRGCCSGGLP